MPLPCRASVRFAVPIAWFALIPAALPYSVQARSGPAVALSFGAPPCPPVLIGPGDGAIGVSVRPRLQVIVTDPDEDTLTVTFRGRKVLAPGEDFTIIMLPDTQYYTCGVNGGTPEMFRQQTRWIMGNADALHIVYAGQLGDIVENEDYHPYEWANANSAMSILEDSLASLPGGLPWDVTVGDHDQTPRGEPDGFTFFYNWYFGPQRFQGRPYYGGHYGCNNDNHFLLFSAGGLDFIVVSLEFDMNQNTAVVAWADSLLSVYSTRHAILLAHYMIQRGNPGEWQAQGSAIYNGLRAHPNLFLMLCAHIAGEGRRTDVYEGRTVHTLLANYQNHPFGGGGYLRIMRFSPALSRIRVCTYTPVFDKYLTEPDSSSQFTLPCDLGPVLENLARVERVPSGGVCERTWDGCTGLCEYEWSVNVSDGVTSIVGDTWRFSTGPSETLTIDVSGHGRVIADPPGPEYDPGSTVYLTAQADSGYVFLGWGGDAGGKVNPLALVMDEPKHIIAHFIQNVPGDVARSRGRPPEIVLAGPNPATPGSLISVRLPREMTVRLSVADVAGRELAELACGRLPAGRHEFRLPARAVPSGVYFLTLRHPGGTVRRTVTVLN
jgi:hypothetical protein